MDPRLTLESVEAMIAEREREANSARPVMEEPEPDDVPITVRFATPDDARDLARLAALDSGSLPAGPALVAEIGGELVAALPLRRGRPLADPFRQTAELVRLLELRQAQLQGRGRRKRRQRGQRRPSGRRPVTADSRV
jgi:hypothetical protein